MGGLGNYLDNLQLKFPVPCNCSRAISNTSARDGRLRSMSNVRGARKAFRHY